MNPRLTYRGSNDSALVGSWFWVSGHSWGDQSTDHTYNLLSHPRAVGGLCRLAPATSENSYFALFESGGYIRCAEKGLRDFEIDDWVFLKVSPMRGVTRLGKKGKFKPRYVGRYKILKSVSNVAYELEFPAELTVVHPIFYISLLKKCVADPKSIVPLESVAMKDSLTYEEFGVDLALSRTRVQRTLKVPELRANVGSEVPSIGHQFLVIMPQSCLYTPGKALGIQITLRSILNSTSTTSVGSEGIPNTLSKNLELEQSS
ncbi:hypothetical protein MTR67_023665 [Solanum verrucosum]|uniref:Tf2-1-like SH3-like domain-containing protein n=1 Tax=Solanum verrucosum TaxID=315347 RepID=A0AAF0TXV2_SOLVR|nr:hypothetical protein MTR67_023665 [Solanum verrucosum]